MLSNDEQYRLKPQRLVQKLLHRAFCKLICTHGELVSDIFGPYLFISNHTWNLLGLSF